MRVFIFGIGGTGSRVLRSLAMLMASGVKFDNPSLEVVPVIIDMDAHNGDTARTREVFRNYYAIRKTFIDPGATSRTDTFFNTKIKSFSRLEAGSTDAADIDLQFDFQNNNDTFAKFVNYNGLSQVNKDVLELMYNDSANDQDFPELYLNLTVGFKGNPNIGSVVFNDLKNSQQFKNLESSFTDQDRVFIISSIFGGTGSSGFPTLVNLIRQSKNPNLARAKLGAITVMPYFNVDSNEGSAINSSLFNTKTKAALSYYANDDAISSINALYYIADHNQSGTLPNVEGGREQINNGHVVELLAASAAIDFIGKADIELEENRCYEFGVEGDINPMNISHFSLPTKEQLIGPMIRFAYAAQIATKMIPQLTDNTFYKAKELNIAAAMGIPNEYHKLLTFFEEFKQWSAEEMSSADNGRAFQSFNFRDPEHLNNLVIGKEIKTSWLSKGLSLKKVAEHLNSIETSEPKDLAVPLKYMNMLYKTANECLTALGQLP
ncbi:hypothetical protein [Mucilaginibacter sp. PAMB04168]|uniref:hypothetical protein n=1 Tax=Mucilaginibacter sp. PAMB04168 TaxID=3138567 RepID=UPI0031F6748D